MAEPGADGAPEEPEMTDTGAGAAFPPYPPYVVEPAPASVADTIIAGCQVRRQHKSVLRKPSHPPPRPAKPRRPKATDVKLPRKALRAHARCLKRHGAVLTDRLERIAKPRQRAIIYLWREHADHFPPETIARLRSALDADEPFKPDQAYQYFINLRKTKKKNAAKSGVNEIKKDILAVYGDKRFLWARNATVAFARGIQQRLAKSGRYAMADGMLRLSNIILHDICSNMHMRTPSRRSTRPKAKFMVEMADKVAVWIDEILAESDDRMLMMDFDEDEDLFGPGGAKFADNFLDMMGDGGAGGGGGGSRGGRGGRSAGGRFLQKPAAYTKFKGPMLEAFMLLMGSMEKKGDANLITHGKFTQTYKEAVEELKTTTDLQATDYNSTLASDLNKTLTETSKPDTPAHLQACMTEIVNICSKYLSQYAEYSKDKGPAFRLLVSKMKPKPDELYKKEKLAKSYAGAADQLEHAKGLENDHDDPILSQEIHSKLSQLMEGATPDELKKDMEETLDISSKYLSQAAVDELERGPAFDILIEELEKNGTEHFSDFPAIANRFACAYKLKNAPGLSSVTPDPATQPTFSKSLHLVADSATPANLKQDMNEVIERCAGYLSAFIRDRDIVLKGIIAMMKSKPTNKFASRPNYTMDYATGAAETESAPALIPYLPIKDIADEGNANITKDMEGKIQPDKATITKVMIKDVSKHLSQPFALRSGIAGARYPLEFLARVKDSMGKRSLFKYKSFGQSYADAANTLMHAGPLETAELKGESLLIHADIHSEMHKGVPSKLAPSIAKELHPVMDQAAKHLAHVGKEKGETMEHLVGMMKEKGEAELAVLQGYQQSHHFGATRLEAAPSLTNDRVEKSSFEKVKGKLTALTAAKKDVLTEKQAEYMPEIIEESSKYLASPEPETDAEKRQVLADLMLKQGEQIVSSEGLYKMTHIEGAQDIKKAPVGVTTAKDEGKKKDVLEKVQAVIPNAKMKSLLDVSAKEGAAHLADTIKARGEALEVINKSLNKEKDTSFLAIGKFNKSHGEVASMIGSAPHLLGPKPAPALFDATHEKMGQAISKAGPNTVPAEHMEDMQNIASKYVAGVATKDSGLNPASLAKLDAKKGFGATAGSGAASGADAGAAGTAGGAGAGTGAGAVDAKGASVATGASGAVGVPGAAWGGPESGSGSGPARTAAPRRRGPEGESDAEHQEVLAILHKQLRAHGGEVLYEQPSTRLTHNQASDWIKAPVVPVEKAVKESGDTARLCKKFEKKLGALVAPVTPPALSDCMQDVIIENARKLAEKFVTDNYKSQASDALISEMQKRGNEILIETDGTAETSFFAAQRLKKAKGNLETPEPCVQEAPRIAKRLDEIMRYRSMPRKLAPSVREHTKEAANYLSTLVTKPNDEIEAYIALLDEMESAGDRGLIEQQVPKSHEESAKYLRQLTSFEDKINRPNSSLNGQINGKLKTLMATVPPVGYNSGVMGKVITDTSGLLTSYAMLQAEKTSALGVLVKHMDEARNNMLLRHGNVRKSFKDGADLLRDKTADQLERAPRVDPVVARKIEIKLHNLMQDNTPDKYKPVMETVIKDATTYLGVHLLEPQVIKVCKCMKNVFVQCELWCEEILRRVAKPACTCSRHVSVQDIGDLAPTKRLRICPGSSRTFPSGLEIAVTECRAKQSGDCQAPHPTTACTENTTTSYLLHSTTRRQHVDDEPTRIPAPSSSNSPSTSDTTPSLASSSPYTTASERCSTVESLLMDIHSQNMQFLNKQRLSSETAADYQEIVSNVHSSPTATRRSRTMARDRHSAHFHRSLTTMFAKIQTRDDDFSSPSNSPQYTSQITSMSPTRLERAAICYNSRTPISMDQMADWHAMMVSLMWNVQAWRKWIQENIDQGLNYSYDSSDAEADLLKFQRRVTTEALQWRQYNIFTRQLATRLIMRYSDKDILSPSRSTVKTTKYREFARAMLYMVDMFNKWTQWLILVVKETATLEPPSGSSIPIHVYRWNHYKNKMAEYSKDWIKYNLFLKVCWEQKYQSFIAQCVPYMNEGGPVWVVSACGAVPSGAVSAGIYEDEVIWIARTTHRSNVLPAALHPTKHCCLVYSEGSVHYYTKYQVMCNADVKWVAWRSAAVGARAVCVAAGVFVGRVLYRGSHLVGAVRAPHYHCHVVIFGRPFAFSCYELLVQAEPV